jgi:hypothetical protein
VAVRRTAEPGNARAARAIWHGAPNALAAFRLQRQQGKRFAFRQSDPSAKPTRRVRAQGAPHLEDHGNFSRRFSAIATIVLTAFNKGHGGF